MTKVYVVEQVKDSKPSRIVGVFSSREAIPTVIEGRRDHDVAECELDEGVGWELGDVYHATVYLPTLEVFPHATRKDTLRHPSAAVATVYGDDVIVASPVSFEHAVEAATEKRQEWQRNRPPRLGRP